MTIEETLRRWREGERVLWDEVPGRLRGHDSQDAAGRCRMALPAHLNGDNSPCYRRCKKTAHYFGMCWWHSG